MANMALPYAPNRAADQASDLADVEGFTERDIGIPVDFEGWQATGNSAGRRAVTVP